MTRIQLVVETTPTIQDPRELHTILITSLRALWGNLERHSSGLTVTATTRHNRLLLGVACEAADAPHVQAAMTCVTPPPYLEDTLYRLDVVETKVLEDE